jgi:hypothetical protein
MAFAATIAAGAGGADPFAPRMPRVGGQQAPLATAEGSKDKKYRKEKPRERRLRQAGSSK